MAATFAEQPTPNSGEVDLWNHVPITSTPAYYNSDSGTGRVIGVRITKKCTISAVYWGSGIALAASDTNYWTFNVLKISNTAGGGSGTALCSAPKESKATGSTALTGGTLVINQLYNMGVNQNLDCEVGDLVYMHMVATLVPTALTLCAHDIRVVATSRP